MTLLWAISTALAFAALWSNLRLLKERNFLRDQNDKLERVHQSDVALIKTQGKTNRECIDTLRAIVTECHGIIGACVCEDDSDSVVEQERSLEAILTECHGTLGNDVSSCFSSLKASEQNHYASNPFPVNHTAPWSSLSALQRKHATEKEIRKAQNKPGFDKFRADEPGFEFNIEDEPYEPCDSVVDEVDSPSPE